MKPRPSEAMESHGCVCRNTPNLDYGTPVKTTQENLDLHDEWTKEALAARKWNVQGKVIAYHDSHGLCYDVEHKDGTVGSYDPSELELVFINS